MAKVMMRSPSRAFSRVGALKPGRSVFDLSHSVTMTGDMGNLYPVLIEEMVPGDTFKVANEIVLRFMPLVAPILHEINVFMHYFSCRFASCGSNGRISFPAVWTERFQILRPRLCLPAWRRLRLGRYGITWGIP